MPCSNTVQSMSMKCTLQYNTIPCNAVQCKLNQCSAVTCNLIQSNAMHCSTVQSMSMKYNLRCNAIKHTCFYINE